LEFWLIIILLVGAIIFKASVKSYRSKSTHQRAPIVQRKPAERRAPFDAQEAQGLPISTTLQGAAYVVDGDTVVIEKTQVRLFGVDAPEMGHPHGNNAKWALVSLCKGEIIRAEITAQDNHGRTVAKCYLQDGRDLSAEMVKLGLAIDWPKFSDGIYASLEVPGVRKKLWLADSRQKGRMHVWERFQAQKNAKSSKATSE